MATRDELYVKFGPRLFEAVVLVMLEEANRVRNWLNKPELTKQDIIDSVNTKLEELEPYDWESDQ